ncbi:hypothetical protein EG329_004392 [Mollisiaceae sp. DMI_Dod_QoI]|nr:hypothetical protein EG329_004392 [Helotiales sp. DMI_Dod_QoI]
MTSLPHEIKRLICDHADLDTVKALRLVSSSWANVGIEILFLPTFVIKSYAIDLQRLIAIGSSRNTAQQAANIIRSLEFRDNKYDPTYLRKIFCSRHVQVSNYEEVHFVPDQREQAALDEIDLVIEQRRLDDKVLANKQEAILLGGFRNVPRVHTIKFTFENPFEQPLLKKVWDEYNLDAYRAPELEPGYVDLSSILSAANRANLKIENFTHDLYNSSLLHEHERLGLHRFLTELKSLSLVINNIANRSEDLDPTSGLRDLLISNPALEHLHIRFETLGRVNFNFIPTMQPNTGHMKSLRLLNISISPASFLSFFSSNASSLKNISIYNVDLLDPDPEFTWQDLLSQIRHNPDLAIDKFELGGLIRSRKETWWGLPIYDNEWVKVDHGSWFAKGRRVPSVDNERTFELENFVLGRGGWPAEQTEEPRLPRMT